MVAWSIPSPSVKSLKIHPVLPPKVPVPSRVKVPLVKLIVPLPVTPPPLTKMSFVPDKVPAVTVKSLSMVVVVTICQPPPEPLKARLAKVEVLLLMEKPVVTAVKVVVWLADLEKLPALSQSPPQKTALASALKTELVATFISPPTDEATAPGRVVTVPLARKVLPDQIYSRIVEEEVKPPPVTINLISLSSPPSY